MGLGETILFYLVFGGAAAVAVVATDDDVRTGERLFRAITAILFWPLYVPVLLSAPRTEGWHDVPEPSPAEPADELSTAVRQVQDELDAALASLDGWAEDVIARECDRIDELKAAWTAQANRVRALDRLLAQSEFARNDLASMPQCAPLETVGDAGHPGANDRLRQSEQARRQNIERLHKVRRQAFDDLMGTLAWVRELVTMIHLAKFTGAPASRAEELVAQIAAAIEGMSEVTNWREEPAMAASSP